MPEPRVAYYDDTEASIGFKAREDLPCPEGKLRIEEGANEAAVSGCGMRARYTLVRNGKAMLEAVEPSGEPPPAPPPP